MSQVNDRNDDARLASRRRFLAAGAVAGVLAVDGARSAALGLSGALAEGVAQTGLSGQRTTMGICIHALPVHMEASRRRGQPANLSDPLALLEFCHALGAGGLQAPLGIRDEQYCRQLRTRAEQLEMWIEGAVEMQPPQDSTERLEAQLRTAVAAGVSVVRCVLLPGRRYEQFSSWEQFQQAAVRAEKALQQAEPTARKHRVVLAVENHKDLRSDELTATINRLGSQYVRVCVDTGNNIALLEDAMDTVTQLAPLAAAVHLKDMDLREYADGFLLSEVPFGEGIVDLPKIVQLLRRANPPLRFSLEMITRDPLRVPCLTDRYQATLGSVPARDLARSLRTARQRQHLPALPSVSNLTLDDQLAAEKRNLQKCIQYAHDRLGLQTG